MHTIDGISANVQAKTGQSGVEQGSVSCPHLTDVVQQEEEAEARPADLTPVEARPVLVASRQATSTVTAILEKAIRMPLLESMPMALSSGIFWHGGGAVWGIRD